jgi:hypothetical protein
VFLDDVIRGEEVFLALGIIRCAEFFAVFHLPKDNKLKRLSIYRLCSFVLLKRVMGIEKTKKG